MKIYGLKNCDTCRKALKSIPSADFVDVRSDGMPTDVLKAALESFAENLVNKRSTTWRNLSEEEREKAPLELLQAHPALMKRPLIEAEGVLYLGWTADVRQSLGVA
ncbi:MAG: arsenate reductase [Rhodobacteraceae bacterium]|nr:arsenate reductase [Paracoccaceae bacterium]